MSWYRVKLTRHIEKAVLEQAKNRHMGVEETIAELVEVGLVSLNTFDRPTMKAAEYATMQPDDDTFED